MLTKRNIAIILIIIVVAIIVAMKTINPASMVSSQQQKNQDLIQEQMAYHVGVMAYLYGYPLVDMHTQMHNETHRIDDSQQTYAPINRFYRFPTLVTPENAGNFRAPNNDTLYYTSWFDISEQPLIIHTPDTNGRYYTIAITNQYAEVTHIGRRTHGTNEQYFALVGPKWQGELPAGVTAIPVETSKGWLLGRMLVDGPEDFDTAMTLVNKVWLAQLSEFTPGQRPSMPAPQTAPQKSPLSSLEFFSIMNQELKNLPARPSEQALMAQFDEIGVGANSHFDSEKLPESTRHGLERAIIDGQELVKAASKRTIPSFNGWMISKDIGRYGFQYMHRASVVKGGYGNLPEESLYPAALFDEEGNLLSGSYRYQLRFAADKMPPVNGFWSLSVYNLKDASLEPNEIARYSIGDRTKGLVYGEDGSLTLSLQHQQPEGPGANWMPVPKGHFMVVMRLYEPTDTALSNEYLLPRIEKSP